MDTAYEEWTEVRRRADDIRELRQALENGEIDFAEFELAS